MALDKTTLGTSIANAFASAHGQGLKSTDTDLGNAIADAIDAYVKAGTVSTTVSTVTACGAGPGTGTGSGTGTMS